MKHIEKRFLFQSKTFNSKKTYKAVDFINIKGQLGSIEQKLKDNKDKFAILESAEGVFIDGFVNKIDGKHFVIPIPDPTLIYFHNAQYFLSQINENRESLLKKLDFNKSLNEGSINEIFTFFGVTSGFVVFLFTAIESFINQLIPDDFIYVNPLKSKTETFNKQQIQEFLDFKTKITKVLTLVTKKDFFSKQTTSNQLIWNLKEFRDEIIHTKQEDNHLKYSKLIKTSFNFKYEKVLEAVANFMNFYKKDTIKECPCENNY